MTKEELYKYAEDKNINISYTNKLNTANGLYLNVDNEDYIILNNNLEGVEEKMVLAEEVAHYSVGVTPTLPFSTDYYNRLIRSKNEFKAFKWCMYNLIPLDRLIFLIKQNKTIYDIAEELNITQDFLAKVLEYYELDLKEVI